MHNSSTCFLKTDIHVYLSSVCLKSNIRLVFCLNLKFKVINYSYIVLFAIERIWNDFRTWYFNDYCFSMFYRVILVDNNTISLLHYYIPAFFFPLNLLYRIIIVSMTTVDITINIQTTMLVTFTSSSLKLFFGRSGHEGSDT